MYNDSSSTLGSVADIYIGATKDTIELAKNSVKKGFDYIRAKVSPKRRFVNSVSMSCESIHPNIVECYRQAAADMKQNFIIMSKLNEAGVASISYDGVDKRVKFIFNDKASNDPIQTLADIADTLDNLYYGPNTHYVLNSVPTTTSVATYDAKSDTINLDDVRKRMAAMLNRPELRPFVPVTGRDSFGNIRTRCDICSTETLFGADYKDCDERLSGNNTPYKRALARNITKITGVDAYDLVTSLYFDGARDSITANADVANRFMNESGLTDKQLIGVMVSASSEFLLKASMADANIHKDVTTQVNRFNEHLDIDAISV